MREVVPSYVYVVVKTLPFAPGTVLDTSRTRRSYVETEFVTVPLS